MALTVTARGSNTNNAGANPLNASPSGNFAAGSWGVLAVTADNASSGGTTNDFPATITDSLGNTWTLRQAPIFDNGAASAGIQGAIYTSDCAVGAPTTGTTIPITTGVAATAKGWSLYEVVPGASKIIKYISGGVNTGATTGTPTVNTGTIRIGDVVVGAYHAENVAVVTGDADATNGSWTAVVSVTIGTTTSGIRHATQTKIQTTADSTQTFNPTAASQDCILSWIQLREGSVISSSFTANAVLRKVGSAGTVTLDSILRKTQAGLLNTVDPTSAWVHNDRSATLTLIGVCRGNGYWVVVSSGTTSSVLYATDPTGTWTGLNHASGYADVAFGNNYFVAVGATGDLRYRATDPTGAWTSNDLGGSTLRAVRYGNGYWVVVGDSGTLKYRATDPTGAFTTVSMDSGITFWNVWYDADSGYWVAVGFDATLGQGALFYATDPSGAWTSNSPAPSVTLEAIVRDHGYWVIATSNGVVYYTAATNPTGAWTSVAKSGTWRAISGDGQRFLMVGDSGTAAYADVPTSWTDKNDAPMGSNPFRAVLADSNYWIGVGSAGNLLHVAGSTVQLTADAVIRKTQTGSLTLDAVIGAALVTRTGTFTIDSVLRREQTASVTADAVLRIGRSGSVTADAIIRQATATPLTVDAVLKRAQQQSITLNARIRAPQKGKVTHQITNSIWYDQLGGTTDIFQSIDEETPDDADYIRTDDNPTAATYEANVSPLEDPLVSSGHVLRVRHLKTGSRTGTITATLYQTSGDIASFPVTPTEDVAATDSYTLSGAEADSIVDYTRLKVRFVGATTGGGPPTQLRVTWFEFEVVGATSDTHESGFLADAVLRRATAATLTADAVLHREQTASVTADAVLRTPQAGSFTMDALLRIERSGSFTSDATLRRGQAGSVTADAVIRREQAGTATLDAVLKAEVTGSFTLSAWIAGQGTSAFSVDAVIKRTQEVSLTADAVIRASRAASFALEAIVNRTASATFTVDAATRAVGSGSITADAVVRKTVLAALTADAVIRQPRMAGFEMNAVLRSLRTASLTTDAVIRTPRAGVLTADATVQRTQSATLSLDAVLRTTRASSVVADAVLRASPASSFTVDAVIAVGPGGGAFTIDAVVRRTQAHALTADAIIQASRSDNFVADALLRRATSGSVSLDAILRRAAAASLSINAIVRASRAAAVTADAVLRVGRTGSFTFDAEIVPLTVFERTGTFSLNAVLRGVHPPRSADIESATRSADIELDTSGLQYSSDIEVAYWSADDEAGGIALSDVSFTEGDTSPPVIGTIKNADKTAVIDLSDVVTVRMQMRRVGDKRYTVNAEAVVTDASGGKVRYQWVTNDLDRPGEYEVQWEMHLTDGAIITTRPPNTLTVTAQ